MYTDRSFRGNEISLKKRKKKKKKGKKRERKTFHFAASDVSLPPPSPFMVLRERNVVCRKRKGRNGARTYGALGREKALEGRTRMAEKGKRTERSRGGFIFSWRPSHRGGGLGESGVETPRVTRRWRGLVLLVARLRATRKTIGKKDLFLLTRGNLRNARLFSLGVSQSTRRETRAREEAGSCLHPPVCIIRHHSKANPRNARLTASRWNTLRCPDPWQRVHPLVWSRAGFTISWNNRLYGLRGSPRATHVKNSLPQIATFSQFIKSILKGVF